MNGKNSDQLRLAVGPIQAQAGPIDIAGLEAGVRHLGRSLAHAVRRVAPMPGHLRPEVQSMPLAVQIATIWKSYSAYSGRGRKGADDRRGVDRFRRIARLYEELAQAGCPLRQADGLLERHVKILLQHWRDNGKQISTIRSEWSILRTWALALGKPGMVGPIETYWPEAPKLPGTPDKEQRAQRAHERMLDESQMTELLRSRDKTHWLIERLTRALGLTVEEALLFDRDMSANYLSWRLVLRGASRRDYRTVPVQSLDQILLVQEVQAFLADRSRKCLAWPDMSMARALRKHRNRVAYLRRKAAGSVEDVGDQTGEIAQGGQHE